LIRNVRLFVAGFGVVGQAVGSLFNARLRERLNVRVVGITDSEWRSAVLRDKMRIGRRVLSGEGSNAGMLGLGEGKEK